MRKIANQGQSHGLGKMNVVKRIAAIALVVVMIVTLAPESLIETFNIETEVEAATSLSNPKIVTDSSMTAGQKVTWDCVWFGSYPQTEIVDKESNSGIYGRNWAKSTGYDVDENLYSALKEGTYDSNGDIEIDGVYYHRISANDTVYHESSTNSRNEYFNWSSQITYRYFRYERIKWKVLSISNGKALLLCDIVLDDQKYNNSGSGPTWENSTIRSWLNGYNEEFNTDLVDFRENSFINRAFSSEEQSAIEVTTLANDDNSYYGTNGGNTTYDKIYLLSESEVYNSDSAKEYGFLSTANIYDEGRRCESSTYAKAMGAVTDSYYPCIGKSWWLLRTPGYTNAYTAYVGSQGDVIKEGTINRNNDSIGIRPALYLNLSCVDQYSYAGTVCSDDSSDDFIEEGANSSDVVADGYDSEIDCWNFLNASSVFKKSSKGYYISSEDYKRLISHLDNKDRDSVIYSSEKKGLLTTFINNKLADSPYKTKMNVDGNKPVGTYISWGGSCYGMSAWVALVKKGLLSVNDLGITGTSTLHELDFEKKIASAINFYHMEQDISFIQNEWNSFLNMSQSDEIKTIINQLSEGPVSIGINYVHGDTYSDRSTYLGHCIVGYGVETGNWNSDDISAMFTNYNVSDRYHIVSRLANRNIIFNKRIKIYDPSNDNTGLQDIYISDSGYICNPANGWISNESNSITDEYNSGNVVLSLSYQAVNLVDYRTGIKNLSSPSDDFQTNNYMKFRASDNFTISSESGSCSINNGNISDNSYDDIIIVPTNFSTSDVLYQNNDYYINLPEDDTFTITSDQDDYYFSLILKDKVITVNSEKSGKVIISSNGEIKIQNDESADCYVRITTNDDVNNLSDYPTVEIINDSCISLEISNDNSGYIINSDNLENAKIQGTDFENTIANLISTDADSALISESKDDSKSVVVSVDSNNDGSFDKVISVSDNHEHSWDTGEITKQPTCTDKGVRTYTCSCGMTRTEDIPSTNHQNTEIRDAIVATCKDEGYTGDTYCKDCGIKISDGTVIPKLATHTWDVGLISKQPTTSEEGIRTYTCTVCGATKMESVAKLPSQPDSQTTQATQPTQPTQSTQATVIVPGTTLTSVKNVKTRKLNIKWLKNTAVNGYVIQMSTNKSFTSGVIQKMVYNNQTTTIKSQKLKKKKTYYVRVCTYMVVNGQIYYSNWSNVKKVKLKK